MLLMQHAIVVSFFFSSRRRHTRLVSDWSSDVCSSDLEIEDATYLNTAAHTVIPRVSIRAVERSLEAKKFPHRVDDSLWFESPVRIRASLARMIGAKPEEIAVTTGASTGAAAVARSEEHTSELQSL